MTRFVKLNYVFADAEVLQRALRLRTPEFVSRNIRFAEAISSLANVCRVFSPSVWDKAASDASRSPV
jgi:hypothetical protein